jgi:hypothetical protein
VQIRKELRHQQRALTEAIQADSRPGKFDALVARKQNDAVANLYKRTVCLFACAELWAPEVSLPK